MSGTNRIFVTATDTGVGKTVFSLFLINYLYSIGEVPFYFKPFQTGCSFPNDTDSDARFIYAHTKQLTGKDPSISVGYCFKEPKAPYFAARNEKKEIDIDLVNNMLSQREKGYKWVIIEGAGGLYVPVTRDCHIIDLIKIFKAYPILVARAGLGTINHTLLSLEALKNNDLTPICVVLIDREHTPKDMIKENIEAIEYYSGVSVAGVIEKVEEFSCMPKNVSDIIKKIIEKFRR